MARVSYFTVVRGKFVKGVATFEFLKFKIKKNLLKILLPCEIPSKTFSSSNPLLSICSTPSQPKSEDEWRWEQNQMKPLGWKLKTHTKKGSILIFHNEFIRQKMYATVSERESMFRHKIFPSSTPILNFLSHNNISLSFAHRCIEYLTRKCVHVQFSNFFFRGREEKNSHTHDKNIDS